MKVKILKAVGSPTFSYAAGTEVKLPLEQAKEFINAGIAESLETATAPKTKETTSTRKGRKKNVDDSGDSEKAT